MKRDRRNEEKGGERTSERERAEEKGSYVSSGLFGLLYISPVFLCPV